MTEVRGGLIDSGGGGKWSESTRDTKLTAVLLSVTVNTVHPRCCREDMLKKREEIDGAADVHLRGSISVSQAVTVS